MRRVNVCGLLYKRNKRVCSEASKCVSSLRKRYIYAHACAYPSNRSCSSKSNCPCNGLARASAIMGFVGRRFATTSPLATLSFTKRRLTLMRLPWKALESPFSANLIADSSSCIVVAGCFFSLLGRALSAKRVVLGTTADAT